MDSSLLLLMTPWLLLLALVLLTSPGHREALGPAIMFVLRPLALAFAYVFVAVIYLPVQVYNFCFPFVPYDGLDEEQARPTLPDRKESDLSIYRVSDKDFQKDFEERFSPAIKKDKGNEQTEWEWEKVEKV